MVDVCRPVVLTAPTTVVRAALCADLGLDEGLYAAVQDYTGEHIGILFCTEDSLYAGLAGTGVLPLRTVDQLESVILQNACGGAEAMAEAMAETASEPTDQSEDRGRESSVGSQNE